MIRGIAVLLFFSSSLFAQIFQQKPVLGRQINWAHPLAKGLVGCWIFNEGSGDKIFDLSGNGNHGTLTNMNPENDWVVSIHGNALDFDGTNDYVNAGGLIMDRITNQITVSAWINNGATAQGDFFVANRSAAYDWGLYHASSNSYHMYIINTAGTNVSVESVSLAVVGIWIHIVGVYDGSRIKIYINGLEEASAIQSGNVRDSGYNTLFAEGWNNKFVGLIDEVRIYSRALSADEIRQLYWNSYDMFIQPNPMFMLAQVAPTPAARRRVIVVQ